MSRERAFHAESGETCGTQYLTGGSPTDREASRTPARSPSSRPVRHRAASIDMGAKVSIPQRSMMSFEHASAIQAADIGQTPLLTAEWQDPVPQQLSIPHADPADKRSTSRPPVIAAHTARSLPTESNR